MALELDMSKLPVFIRLAVELVMFCLSLVALPWLLVVSLAQSVVTASCFRKATAERAVQQAFPWARPANDLAAITHLAGDVLNSH